MKHANYLSAAYTRAPRCESRVLLPLSHPTSSFMPRKDLAISLPAKKGRFVQGNSDQEAQGPLWDEDTERGLCREQHQCRAQLDTSFKQMELATPS